MNYYDNLTQFPASRLVYVNQQLLIDKIQNGKQCKVLLNPKFINSKPHFNKEFLINNKIHINPLFHKNNKTISQELNISKTVATNLSNFSDNLKDSINNTDKTNKKIEFANKIGSNEQYSPTLHTKYKIIRSNNENYQDKLLKIPSRNYPINTRFKIDRLQSVNSKIVKIFKQAKIKNRYRYIKYSSSIKQAIVINNRYLNSFIKSKESLNIANRKLKLSSNNLLCKTARGKLLTIRGQKYKLNKNGKTLSLLTKNVPQINFKSVQIGRVMFRRKDHAQFIKINNCSLSNILKKSNIPCPIFRKYGKCKGKDLGTCIRIHNPQQVSLCPKFLRGACLNDKCLLSHKTSAEKMPTCRFFLEGICTKENCPYLHVKINAKAEICKDFLEGFCQLATECLKRHQFLCPDFEKDKKCLRRNCPYPHLGLVKTRIMKEVTPVKPRIKIRIVNKKAHKKNALSNKDSKSEELDVQNEAVSRYFTDNLPNTSENEMLFTNNQESLWNLDISSNINSNLPSFIPF